MSKLRSLTIPNHHKVAANKILTEAMEEEPDTVIVLCFWKDRGQFKIKTSMVPDRLSYVEMYADIWRYPEEWTESFESYLQHKDQLIAKIVEFMSDYDEYRKLVPQQARSLEKYFFSATNLIENLK